MAVIPGTKSVLPQAKHSAMGIQNPSQPDGKNTNSEPRMRLTNSSSETNSLMKIVFDPAHEDTKAS